MREPILYEFNPIIYPVKLWIVKYPNENFIHENFEEPDGTKLNLDIYDHHVLATYNQPVVNKKNEEYGILSSIASNPDIGEIAHEATHIAKFIWEHLGEYEMGQEANAYLIQWITYCFWKIKINKAK